MAIDIEKLSFDELIGFPPLRLGGPADDSVAGNRRVVRRLQYLGSLKTRAQLDKFEVGGRVTFQSDARAVEGIVIRVNRKTLSIRTKDTHWNIHPKFLTKVLIAGSTLPQDIRNLIEGQKD